MYLAVVLEALSDVDRTTQIITPFLPVLGTIFGGILIGAFAVWNRKRGAVETRAPDVNEIWVQKEKDSHELDIERRLRRRVENLYYDLRRAFIAYVRRVKNGGSMELTATERHIIESGPATGEIDTIDPNSPTDRL